ncbi:MAG: DUF58 domain-containing protein [Gemmatimonadota bacterium]
MAEPAQHRREPGSDGQSHPGARFIDPRALARIDNLELVARTVVSGFLNGLHRSPYLGASLDFAEHRPYLPGDDIRRIDWKLLARSDRLYVKLFEAETNANFVAALDVSRSMNFGSAGVTKLEYARFLVATLTYFSQRQRDRIGLVTFAEDLIDFVPASAKHLDTILHTLARLDPAKLPPTPPRAAAEGDVESNPFVRTFTRVADALRRKGILVVVSDFYEPTDAVVEALSRVRYAGQDVIAFHLLDPAEIQFPFEQPSSFEDLESELRIPIVPEKLRQRYRELIDGHMNTLSSELPRRHIDHILVDTSKPLDLALFEYLSLRVKLSRVR